MHRLADAALYARLAELDLFEDAGYLHVTES